MKFESQSGRKKEKMGIFFYSFQTLKALDELTKWKESILLLFDKDEI